MQQGCRSNPKFELSKDLKVGVFCGGRSSERKISKLSGHAVYHALQRRGFSTLYVDPACFRKMEERIRKIDVAFLALHGHGGEDGVIQRYLEKKSVPYVGSDPKASGRAFDKSVAKRIFLKNGIPTPSFRIVNRANWKKTLSGFPAPFFLKPVSDGSSIGVFIVEDFEKSVEKIKRAFLGYPRLLAEEKITGREFTVGILGERALPVIELLPKRSFYDYRAKYTKGMTEYAVPAEIPKSWSGRLQEIALRVHRCLGLRDLSRVDIMADRRGNPFVLEANSIPGFTEFSLLPKAAKSTGMAFEDLCSLLVSWAYQRQKGFRSKHGEKKA